MAYAFGAAGAAAPPPAGAGAAALSSAAFTAWPLKVRVGANSPSLCPIICSVTYTGINFLPLCTAMVWPIKSGTIVERRDQVLTTFFSLRVLSPSTFSRRVPSTNGPFFSERAISVLYSSTRRKRPQGACRIFLNPRTGPGTRCDFGQNGQTNLLPIAFGARSTITAHPGLQSLYSAGSNGIAVCFFSSTAAFTTGFATGFGAVRFATRLLDRFAPRRTAARRPAVRLVRVARIVRSSFAVCLSRECSPSTAYKV